MSSKPDSAKGQATLELALVLPILILLLFGIMEFGRIFNASLTIAQAAREGARVGAVGGSDEEILSAVKSAAATLDLNRLQVSVDPPDSSPGLRVRGGRLRVEVNYSVSLVAPVIAEIIPNPYPLKAVAVMRIE